jgi:2'-5' RNA ligase
MAGRLSLHVTAYIFRSFLNRFVQVQKFSPRKKPECNLFIFSGMRLFVGISLPPEIIGELMSISYGIQGARWEGKERLHLTLRFIGETEGSKALEFQHLLSQIQAQPFLIQINGVGVFPLRGNPRIVWAGIKKCPALTDLQNRVEKILVHKGGLTPEKRKYHPHITLARLKNTPAEEAAGYIMAHSLLSTAPFTVRFFSLFSSILSPKGAKYFEEAVFALQE